MSASGLHIAISAEPVLSIGKFVVSNSILSSLIVSGLLISFAVAVRLSLRPNSLKPRGLQNVAEWIVEALYNLNYSVTGSHKKARHFFPFVSSFFLFILLNNWLGLFPGVGTIGYTHVEKTAQLQTTTVHVPVAVAQASTDETVEVNEHLEVTTQTTTNEELPTGTLEEEHSEVVDEHGATEETHGSFVPYFRAGTADLNTTLALAAVSVFMTQVFGVMYLKLGYFSKFINFSSPIAFFIGLLELVLETAKIISFAFRLFGNIFAGEVLLAVISFLVPVIVPMPFYGLEIAVGMIQALVFSMLSLVFFNMATMGHDDH